MNKIQSTHLLCCLTFLLISFSAVCPGANDLHFHDGASTADVISGDVFFEILDPPELMYSYRIRPAKDFGAPFNASIQFTQVRLVPTVPLHSCTDIINENDISGNVALSERGECSFVSKTAKAQAAGARALIITESVDKWDDTLDHLIEMVDDKMELDVNIPAGFLLGRSGAAILRTLRRLNRNYAIINLPVNLTHVPINKMNQPPWIAWLCATAFSLLLGRIGRWSGIEIDASQDERLGRSCLSIACSAHSLARSAQAEPEPVTSRTGTRFAQTLKCKLYSCPEAVNMKFFWVFTAVTVYLAALASTFPAPSSGNFFEVFEGIMDRLQEAIKNVRPAVDVVMNARELFQGGQADEQD